MTRGVAAAALATMLLGGGVAAAHAAGDEVRSALTCPEPPNVRGIELSATVLGPPPKPEPTSTAAPTPVPSCGPSAPPVSRPSGSTPVGSSGGSGSPSTRGPGSVAPGASVEPVVDLPPGPDEFELGGVLYLGGLSSGYSPSPNPFGGDLQLWFTVRNVSDSAITMRADFWMEGPFGNRIGQVDDVRVVNLKPGERRTISADVPGVGQWTLISAHARLTPPKVVDGTELTPVTRDAFVFAPPWLIGVTAAALLGAAAVRHFLRRAELPIVAGETA
ncbi:hypothetical protein DCE93_12970 [Agromyces badenianii]|uniref:DUF916 domain-containing protein n=1 Tax=Agromyces badenianii TaxID=2080742 RepID=A0A2S0WYP0_9MICO|nr:hypothetical protein [Agromyces badenianii]AWB96446.1 hypothetical protein DCE93_12970 [Agromyces badenianii]